MKSIFRRYIILFICIASTFLPPAVANSVTLEEIRQRGTLKHLGAPYAKFANNDGEGLDCALIKRFAAHLGVSYQYVPTEWPHAIRDLTGHDPNNTAAPASQIKGDLIACGFTMLPHRRKYVIFSQPTFTSQIWLLAKNTADIQPIEATGILQSDIYRTLAKVKGKTIVGIADTCIDATLLPELEEAGAHPFNLPTSNLAIPYKIRGNEYEFMLIESINAFFVMSSWPQDFKIIGPVSEPRPLGVAFAPESTELQQEFSRFFKYLWKSGRYKELAKIYYRANVDTMKEFFAKSEP